MALVSLIGLARERKLPVEVAVWTPNAVFAIASLILLVTLERPGDRDIVASLGSGFRHYWALLRDRFPKRAVSGLPVRRRRWFLLPQIIDTYVLSNFIFYFAVLLTSLVLLIEFYNFFELLGDLFRTNSPMRDLFTYLFFLAPKLIYDSAPLSVLVGVLVTFGILTKSNEITAMKACGVSVHRLALPVFVATAAAQRCPLRLRSLRRHRRQRHPGRAPQQDQRAAPRRPTSTRSGNGSTARATGSTITRRSNSDVMAGVSVFDLEPGTFHMNRHINAERARWEPRLKTWVFQNGWVRENIGRKDERFRSFAGSTATFPELTEPPGYFLKEVKTYKQMNYPQLEAYIQELQQSGFNTIPLQVQYHKKFSLPLFAFIMALLSVPFAFLTGGRGAMTGVGVSFGITIAYFAVNLLFEQLGNVNQLPPALAAWSPLALFALAGLFLMARMRT